MFKKAVLKPEVNCATYESLEKWDTVVNVGNGNLESTNGVQLRPTVISGSDSHVFLLLPFRFVTIKYLQKYIAQAAQISESCSIIQGKW